jgi:hypothetical protein
MHPNFRSLRILKYLFVLVCFFLPSASHAEDALPETVQAELHIPLQKVGSGTYRKFGFTIYHVTLWAPKGEWDPAKPYALELRYARSLSQETLADATIDNIRDENVADEATFARWSAGIKKTMPAVEDGDVMIGVENPGSEAVLFFNGNQIAKTKDQSLAGAFFNIWLGDGADEDLKNDLLAKAE